MPTLQASGTQTAVIATEHTLTTLTSSETYVLAVDANAMVLGDKTTLRVKTKVLSGGVTREIYVGEYQHVQGRLIKVSVPVPSDQEFVATLEQTAGTGRAYPWKVLSL